MKPTSQRSVGILIACVGVLAAGPDAAYLRAQHEAGGSTTVIGVWRYSLLAVCNLCLGSVFSGCPSAMLAGLRRSPLPVLGASSIIVLINAGFTLSLTKVNAALALLVISLSPLWAALLGWLGLGD